MKVIYESKRDYSLNERVVVVLPEEKRGMDHGRARIGQRHGVLEEGRVRHLENIETISL